MTDTEEALTSADHASTHAHSFRDDAVESCCEAEPGLPAQESAERSQGDIRGIAPFSGDLVRSGYHSERSRGCLP